MDVAELVVDAHNDTRFYDKPNQMSLNDDCLFLLYFTMGVYFGPDIIECKDQPKSALQRITEHLPPYTLDQLGGSRLKMSEVEEIYHSLLSKADQSLVVHSPIFLKFLLGSLPLPLTTPKGDIVLAAYPQFPCLFPSALHPLSESLNGNQLIENIVHIRRPEISSLNLEDVERFRKLTCEDLTLPNRFVDEFPSYQHPRTPAAKDGTLRYYKRKPRINRVPRDVPDAQQDNMKRSSTCGGDCSDGIPPEIQRAGPGKTGSSEEEANDDGPAMLILPTPPTKEVLDKMVSMSNHAYALTGGAAKGHVGPAIGMMDIDESDDSYFFRVALPGVRRENGAFRCEVESNGKVLIKGETVTGEKQVTRYTQVFEMQTHNLCPPGPFSISFQLPGSVDHRKFRGNFTTHGILEGVVMKAGAESAALAK